MTVDERVRELYDDGLEAFRRGDEAASRAANDAALERAREIGGEAGQALALVGISRIALREGEYDHVKELAREARSLARSTGDRSAEVGPLHLLAAGTRLSGDYDAARGLYLESIGLNQEIGNERMVTVELHNLGHVELHRGDVVAAAKLFEDRRARRNGSDPYERAMDALNDAALAIARGETRGAAELLAEAERTLADAGIVLDPDDWFELETLRSRLG